MRRRSLLTASAGLVTASGGCLGALTGSEPVERTASDATVQSSTRSESGYELERQSTETIERDVTVAGQTRTVVAKNQLAEYNRAAQLAGVAAQELAVFAVVATPAFEIAGRTMSPVAQWSDRKIAEAIQEQYSNLEVGSKLGERDVTTLGGSTPLSKFEATGTVAGEQGVELHLHAGKRQHEGDFVIAVGIYPRKLVEEGSTVRTLVGGLRHGE